MTRARQVNYTFQDVAGTAVTLGRGDWVHFSEQLGARTGGNSTSVPGKGRKISLKVFIEEKYLSECFIGKAEILLFAYLRNNQV